jgi:hypothetical protein
MSSTYWLRTSACVTAVASPSVARGFAGKSSSVGGWGHVATLPKALQLASDRVRKITLRILRDIFRYSLFDDLDALDNLDRSRFQSFLHAQALAVRPDPSFALVA